MKNRQELLLELAQLERQIVAMSDRKHYVKKLLKIRTRRYPFKPPIEQAAA